VIPEDFWRRVVPFMIGIGLGMVNKIFPAGV